VAEHHARASPERPVASHRPVDWSASPELPQLFHLGRGPEEYYDVSERYPDVLADVQTRLTAFDTALKPTGAAYGCHEIGDSPNANRRQPR
jgi:hypothetical protein